MGPFLAFLAMLARGRMGSFADAAQSLLVLAGVSIAALSLLGRFTTGYIHHAEQLATNEGLRLLEGDKGRKNRRIHSGRSRDAAGAGAGSRFVMGGGGNLKTETLVAVWHEGEPAQEIIATCVVRDDGAAHGPKSRTEIWAWTVRLRYRGHGLGQDMVHFPAIAGWLAGWWGAQNRSGTVVLTGVA